MALYVQHRPFGPASWQRRTPVNRSRLWSTLMHFHARVWMRRGKGAETAISVDRGPERGFGLAPAPLRIGPIRLLEDLLEEPP